MDLTYATIDLDRPFLAALPRYRRRFSLLNYVPARDWEVDQIAFKRLSSVVSDNADKFGEAREAFHTMKNSDIVQNQCCQWSDGPMVWSSGLVQGFPNGLDRWSLMVHQAADIVQINAWIYCIISHHPKILCVMSITTADYSATS